MEKLTPADVVAIYKAHGETVTLEEATRMLAFMWELANLSLDQTFDHDS